MSKRKIPTGSVYQRVYRNRRGKAVRSHMWTLKYYIDGKPRQEPSGTDDYQEALALLRKRMAGLDQTAERSLDQDLVRMNQLFDLLAEDYKRKRRKSAYDTLKRLDRHLRPYFGSMKASEIGTDALLKFIRCRERQRAAEATINKELTWVRRALNLGAQHEPPLVARVPRFDLLPVDNARQGIVEHDQYRAVRDRLPLYARIALVIGYHTGARKGEISSLQTRWVDLKALRIHLPGRVTKNGRSRYLPIYGEMRSELDMWLSRIRASSCPFLIQDDGLRVFSFYKAWKAACKGAGIPQTLFHDLRRTAVTNMVEAGLSEKEAMEISGHKTRYVFDRYHIVSDRRMKQNAEKVGEHLKAKDRALMVTDTVTDKSRLVQ